jgi:bisphosphoglycerate-dependent phosphoglycerate mutase
MFHFIELNDFDSGLTDLNKESIVQGQIDTLLCKEGIEQARRVGEHLENVKLTHAYSSDLKRAYYVSLFILLYIFSFLFNLNVSTELH